MITQLEEDYFETKVTIPKPRGIQQTTFTAASRFVSESSIVPNSAWISLLLEKNAKAGTKLVTVMKKAYSAMLAESDFTKLLSRKTFATALGAQLRPGTGHCYVRHSAGSPTVLFLHGFGGNFLFYAWALKKLIPNSTLINPSCGMDWLLRPAADNLEYIDDLLKHFHHRIGLDLSEVWLAGISDGGVASFEIASLRPGLFRGLISFASSPIPMHPNSMLPRGYKVLMLNGAEDDRFPIKACAEQAATLAKAGIDLKFVIISEGDHFFILSHPEKMKTAIESFMAS